MTLGMRDANAVTRMALGDMREETAIPPSIGRLSGGCGINVEY